MSKINQRNPVTPCTHIEDDGNTLMFTGIIQAVGSIASLERRGGDVRLGINAGKLPMADVAPGDSIAVSGVCLTVIEKTAGGFHAAWRCGQRRRQCGDRF